MIKKAKDLLNKNIDSIDFICRVFTCIVLFYLIVICILGCVLDIDVVFIFNKQMTIPVVPNNGTVV